jgi:hypothetical protein
MRKVSLGLGTSCFNGSDVSGKTSEAKGDMARLQEVRRRREAAAKQREAEAAGVYPPYIRTRTT